MGPSPQQSAMTRAQSPEAGVPMSSPLGAGRDGQRLQAVCAGKVPDRPQPAPDSNALDLPLWDYNAPCAGLSPGDSMYGFQCPGLSPPAMRFSAVLKKNSS